MGLGAVLGAFHWFVYDEGLKHKLGKDYAMPLMGVLYGAGQHLNFNLPGTSFDI